MIRTRRITTDRLNQWLPNLGFDRATAQYRLRLWQEDGENLEAVKDELIAYFDEALDDARRRLRSGLQDALSPFTNVADDPAAHYPDELHHNTLLGYLGETLGVLAVEHWGAHEASDWHVPALLFRFHEQEFQHLDEINERILSGATHNRDEESERRPGRTGDDALAFRLSESNVITHQLVLESKCLTQNNATKIKEAHQKLSSLHLRSSGIRELIELMNDYETPEAQAWQGYLIEFWRNGYRNVTRLDGFLYACGNRPKKGRVSWNSSTAPHVNYSADRGLEVMEFHLSDLESLAALLYRGVAHAKS